MIPPKIQNVYTSPSVDTMDVRNIDLTSDVVVWSRGGEKRYISKSMLIEAAKLLLDGERMVEAGRMPVVPPEWFSIYWTSCRLVHVPTTVTVA